jgi:hypothetical protein
MGKLTTWLFTSSKGERERMRYDYDNGRGGGPSRILMASERRQAVRKDRKQDTKAAKKAANKGKWIYWA